jgi:hypothetical protein
MTPNISGMHGGAACQRLNGTSSLSWEVYGDEVLNRRRVVGGLPWTPSAAGASGWRARWCGRILDRDGRRRCLPALRTSWAEAGFKPRSPLRPRRSARGFLVSRVQFCPTRCQCLSIGGERSETSKPKPKRPRPPEHAAAAASASMGRKERGAHAAGKKDRPVSVSAMLASLDAPAVMAAKPSKPKGQAVQGAGVVLPGRRRPAPPPTTRRRICRPRLSLLKEQGFPSRRRPQRRGALGQGREEEGEARARGRHASGGRQAGGAPRRLRRHFRRPARAPAAKGPASAAADNARDIVLGNFFVSAPGAKLLDGASLRVSHGRRYGFVGPNGKGKSSLLKKLARRELPGPRNIDVLLVEQEVASDIRTAIEAVVAADEELTAARRSAAPQRAR